MYYGIAANPLYTLTKTISCRRQVIVLDSLMRSKGILFHMNALLQLQSAPPGPALLTGVNWGILDIAILSY